MAFDSISYSAFLLSIVLTHLLLEADCRNIRRSELFREDYRDASATEVRQAIRLKEWTRTTHGLARGFVQANLAIVPQEYAFDFLRFCQRNPKPCPLLDVTDPGDPEAKIAAPGSDISRDLSGYRVYRDGEFIEQVEEITHLWRGDHVGFLLGCSMSFDYILGEAGIPQRHLECEEGRMSVYTTNIECVPSGPFSGPMVVGMRPTKRALVPKVVEITSRYPLAHGSPVHIGDPAFIGIDDPERVDWGQYNAPMDDEMPVYWACGITPQAIAMAAKIPEMITHSAGCMFITDIGLSDMVLSQSFDGWVRRSDCVRCGPLFLKVSERP